MTTSPPPILRLAPEQCATAAELQAAIDSLGADGGRVELPELDLALDRGIELRSNVELRGQGEKTILRKGPGRVYPLRTYHNYGMTDVPVASTDGLTVGMTVSVRDKLRRGFYSTFARITWIDGTWVGLDRGIAADYLADSQPELTTAYPLIFAHESENIAVHDVSLEGSRAENEAAMDGCRGGSIYFGRCHGVEVGGVHERDFHGEGLSFQMCSRVRIRDCRFGGNSGNGLHPGAGSTDVLFENCESDGNDLDGFFFCVRATRVTVRGCTFLKNRRGGISIGTRDCYNLIEDCRIADNRGPGIIARPCDVETEVHSCVVRNCVIENNAVDSGEGQIALADKTHDLAFEANTIRGCAARPTPGIHASDEVERIYLSDNEFSDCPADTEGSGFAAGKPNIVCGHETVQPVHYRHLM